MNFRRTLDSITVCLLVLLLVLFGRTLWRNRNAIKSAAVPTQSTSKEQATDPIGTSPSGVQLTRAKLYELAGTGIRQGDTTAPAVTVLAYLDYSCGWCQKFDTILGRLESVYPNHLLVIYKDLVLDTNSVAMEVHQAARCAADQDAFMSYNKAAFANQPDVSVRGGWKKIAEIAHIPNMAKLARCVGTEQHLSEVLANTREGRSLGFNATPSSIVGSIALTGFQSYQRMDSLVSGQIVRAARRH